MNTPKPKHLLKGEPIQLGRDELRRMGFPVSDSVSEPVYGTFQVDGKSVTVNIVPKLREETDLKLIAGVERTFGRLTLDLAATDEDHKAPKWISPERDTFTVNWAEEIGDGIGWLNPPLDPDLPWFQKCALEGRRGARFLVITNAPIDSYQFWEYLLPNAIIYVLYPRMAYQGEPMPMVLAAFNVQHKGRKELDLTQLHLWNWVTGLIR